jgi:hypothetical protein
LLYLTSYVHLQENVGNKFGLPVTFHQIVMQEDAISEGEVRGAACIALACTPLLSGAQMKKILSI